MTSVELAEKILNAAGSSLRNYTAESRAKIIAAAIEIIDQINKENSK